MSSEQFPTIKNISLFQKPNQVHIPPRPARQEGRAHVTNARRDAVDAGLRWDDGAKKRTAKPCGPGARRRRQAVGRSASGNDSDGVNLELVSGEITA